MADIRNTSGELKLNLTCRPMYDGKRHDINSLMTHFVLHVPVMFIIAITGLIANSLAFIILGKESRTKKSSPVFILRVIAIADSVVLIMNILQHSCREVFQFTGHWEDYYEFYNLSVNGIWFLTAASKVFATYLVILMTTDRWLACCRPLRSRSLCTRKNAATATIILLLISLLYSIPKLWVYDITHVYDNCTQRYRPRYKSSKISTNVYYDKLYTVSAYIVVNFVIPMLSLICMNAGIVVAVRRSTMDMRTARGGSTTEKNVEALVTKRAVIVALAFFILEGPSMIFHFITLAVDINVRRSLSKFWMPIIYDVSAINNCINFFLYCLVGKRFRAHLVELFCGRARKKRAVFSNSSSAGEMTEISLIKS